MPVYANETIGLKKECDICKDKRKKDENHKIKFGVELWFTGAWVCEDCKKELVKKHDEIYENLKRELIGEKLIIDVKEESKKKGQMTLF